MASRRGQKSRGDLFLLGWRAKMFGRQILDQLRFGEFRIGGQLCADRPGEHFGR